AHATVSVPHRSCACEAAAATVKGHLPHPALRSARRRPLPQGSRGKEMPCPHFPLSPRGGGRRGLAAPDEGRASSSFHLPSRGAVLVVVEHDAHGGKLVTNAITLRPVLRFAGIVANGDFFCHIVV